MAEKVKSLVLVLFKPKKTFALVKEEHLSLWFLALLTLSIVMFATAVIKTPVMQKQSAKALQAQIKLLEKDSREAVKRGAPPIPPDQLAAMKKAAKTSTSSGVILGSEIFAVIGLWIGALLSALALTVFVKVFRRRLTFQQSLNLVALAFMAFVVGEIVKTIFVVASGSFMPMQGMASLIIPNDPSKAVNFMSGGIGFTVLLTALQRLDIFVLWSLFILAVGFTALADLTKRQAALLALTYWLSSWLLTLLPTLLPVLLLGPMGTSTTSSTAVKGG